MLTRAFQAAVFPVAIGLAAVAPPTTLTFAQEDRSRLVTCKLVVDGIEFISGVCRFTPIGRDGSFQITSGNGQYFAQVMTEAPGVGIGYWNEERYASHAHSILGELAQLDACWVNARVSVCAW